MTRSENASAFKMAAIDLDGTLLGGDHQISAANARAVEQLRQAGAQVVLASGRHFDSMQKYALALPGVQWVVSCQGGEVSDAHRKTILSRTFLPGGPARDVLELGSSLGFTPVVYSVEGVFTDAAWNGEMDFYRDLAGHAPVILSTAELFQRGIFKVIWMGEPEKLSSIALAAGQLPPSVQSVRTNARFLEFMPVEVSKGTALATLAGKLGIDRSDVVVFGDGENDIPMFHWASTSVAMPHGWPEALRQATWVAPDGPEETALARGVELVLANKAAA
jgi:Cof subfamily protein (haloacid dehalogenase superfamily)